jgi:putative ABC transport system ATP-binding protein
MKTPLIKLKDVWKIYNLGEVKVEALRGLSLIVKKGEFVAIMGASGSGKSTAMNMVGCLDIPSKGTVYLEGKDISKLSESRLAQIRGRKIGFVFQQFNLISSLSALENVILPMMFQNVPSEKRIENAKKILASVGLEKRIHHRPTELAGGEQQRVAIARSLANDPEIILADEPTGNLDSKTGKMIMKILVDLHKEHKKTIVVITHDAYIARYAKRKLSLKDGKILKDHVASKRYLWSNKK